MPSIDIASVTLGYHNPNNELIERIKATYLDIGQIRPIYVQKSESSYNVFEGSAIYLALKDAGAEQILAVVLKKENIAAQTLINIILSHQEQGRSLVQIAEKIKSISDTFPPAKLAKYLSYDQQTIEDLINLLEFDWSDFETSQPAEQNNLFDL